MSTPGYPVRVDATLEPSLSRWLWLVKWLLVIPHYIVLAFLWLAFAVLSVFAFLAILFTGRYPRTVFDFNVGVLRWTWRVTYYAYGGLGTDHYPPFTLSEVPDYPAHLEVPYPERLSRGLVLVKWWLLAIPHYLVLAVFLGGGWYVAADGNNSWQPTAAGGLIGLLVLVAAVVLLFTGRYPQPIFDLVLGLNRWVLRVAAYVGLMTDEYPPFRLDMGGQDPNGGHLAVPPRTPEAPADRSAGPTTAPPAAEPPAIGTPATATAPPQGTAPPTPPSGSGWGAGRVVAIVVGAVVLVMGLGLLGAGATLGVTDRVMRDGAGYLMSPSLSVTSPGSAVTSQSLELSGGPSSTLPEQLLGRAKVRVDTGAGQQVFVGVARSRDAAAYLAGVGYSTVIDPSGPGGEPTYRQHPGGVPAQPPTTAGIWAASTAGTGRQTFTWPVRQGDWTLVVMNADGSRGVAADVAVGATVPAATGVVVGLLVAGGLLLIVSVLILVLALRRPERKS